MLQVVPAYLRSQGHLSLRFERRAGGTVLHQRQEGGCLRVRVPRGHSAMPEAVVINTAGGLCGGDTIAQDIAWSERSGALVTTQAAEKVYGSQGPATAVTTRLTVAAGARAEWLPQDTILFDGARLERDTSIDIARDAALLWSECVLFGRTARGESFTSGRLRDRIRVWRDGRLVYADVLDLYDAPAARLARAALGDGARAAAVIVALGTGFANRLNALKSALAEAPGVLGGASAWNGIVAARLIARDPAALRRALVEYLVLLRGGAPMPRVWSC